MTEPVAPQAGERWLVAAMVGVDQPVADLVAPLGGDLVMLGWRADEPRIGVAVRGAARALRGARGSMLTLGAAHGFRGLLLGWTAARLEACALARARWVRRPALSRRMQSTLCEMSGQTAALEILARSAPSDPARWMAWGRALRRDENPYAAAVLARAALLLGRALPAGRLADIGDVATRGRLDVADRVLGSLDRVARKRGERAIACRLAGLRVRCLSALGAWEEVDAVAAGMTPIPPTFAYLDEPVGTPVTVDPDVTDDEVGLVTALAEACRLAGRHADADRHGRHLLDLAERRGDTRGAAKARVDLAWSALVGGDADTAASWAETVEDDAEQDEAALVGAAASLQVGDAGRAGQLATQAARASNPSLAWMATTLRARLERGTRPPHELLGELAVASRTRRALGGVVLRTAEQWLDACAPVDLLAAELACAEGDAARALVFAETDAWRRLRLPGTPDLAAAERVRKEARMDAITLVCGDADVGAIRHGPASAARLEGAAPEVRALAGEIDAAIRGGGALARLLGMLGTRLAPLLAWLAEPRVPLLIVAHGGIERVPWDLVPVAGRALGSARPVAQSPALSLLEPGRPSASGKWLLGPEVAPVSHEASAHGEPARRACLSSLEGWAWLGAHGGPRRLRLHDGDLHARALRPGDVGAGIVLLSPRWPAGQAGHDEIAPALLAAGACAVVAPVGPVGADVADPFLATVAHALAAGASAQDAFHAARASACRDTEAGLAPGAAGFRLLLRGVPIAATIGG